MSASEKIYIIGVGDDGLDGLTSSARQLVERADLVMGEELALARCNVPNKHPIGSDLDGAVARVDQRPDERAGLQTPGSERASRNRAVKPMVLGKHIDRRPKHPKTTQPRHRKLVGKRG